MQALGTGAHTRHETDDASAYSRGLLDLKREFYGQLTLRVSIVTSMRPARGGGRPDTRAPMINGLKWLRQNQFTFHLAGSTPWGEYERTLQEAHQHKLTGFGIIFDIDGPTALISFPEIDPAKAVPEITIYLPRYPRCGT